MSGNLKTNLKRGGLAVLGTIGLWCATEIFDEVTKRVGFGPRQLVPETLSRQRTAPPEVRAAEKKTPGKLETGSIAVPRIAPKEAEAARQAARARCLKEKAKAISEDEARIATIKAEWEKCLRWARWWPLVVGDAQTYCGPWERAKLGVEAGLEVARSWSCER